MKHSWLSGASAVAWVASLALSGTALAQSAPDAVPGESAEAEADVDAPAGIVVTGSRLATGFSMPTPVTAIGADELAKTSPTTVAESLAQLPALSGTQVSSSSGRGSGNSQSNGQSLLNLRGMGPYRTLVLFNGARMGPSNSVGSVDVNIIPKELIRQVDVVTGGASASYGSDAVAGVVNFVLDTKFQGLKLSATKGITTYGDAANTSAAAAFGTSLGDRFHIIGSAEYFTAEGIQYGLNGRQWMDFPEAGYPNPAGTPATITPVNVRVSNASYGGLITAVAGCPTGDPGAACRALVGKEFVGNGVVQPFEYGTNVGAGFMTGGGGPIATNGISPDAERISGYLHAEYEVADNHTLWAEGLWARNYTYVSAQPARINGATNFMIYEGNPYLPSSISSLFAATAGTQTFRLARYSIDWPSTDVLGVTKTWRVAGGAKGDLGAGWSYDLMGAYQHTHQDLDIFNTIENRKYAAADAVIDPATNKIVCRVTLTNPGLYPGCVPINLFGNNVADPASTSWFMGWNTADLDLNQLNGEANIRGDLGFGLPAGSITTAFGAAARKLTARRQVDALSAINIDATGIRGMPASLVNRYGSYQFYNPSPIKGETTVYEGYGEIGIPLIANTPLFQSLDATVAGRYTHYSQSGWEPTWKLGLNWTVNPDVRFRLTYSQDARAPSVVELFNTAQVTTQNSLAPFSTAATVYRLGGQTISVGNRTLEPEGARTLTAGVVLTPSFIPGLQMSLDYYRIKIKGAILAPGAQNIVDGCYNGNTDYCSLIIYNNAPVTKTILGALRADDPVFITNPLLNLGEEKYEGLDFEAAYRTDLGAGNVRFRLTANYNIDIRTPAGCIPGSNEVGSLTLNCPYPRFRANLSANYTLGAFNLFIQERMIGSGVRDKSLVEGVTIDENRVPATWYTDLNLAVNIGEAFGGEAELTLNITNLFNQAPRNTSATTRSWVESSNNGIYDLLGRRFVAGVRFKM